MVVATDRYVAEDAAERIRGRLRLPARGGRHRDRPRRRRTRSTPTCPATSRRTMVQEVGDADGGHRRGAAQRSSSTLWIERSASMPMEGKGVLARWDERRRVAAGAHLDADLDQRAAGDRRQARPARRPGRGGHARRGRRLRRQDRAPVARGDPGAVGGDPARPAGQVGRGPARALRLLRARARPAARGPGRVRRRGPAAGALGEVLARQRRLHAVRPDRPDHHLDPAARALQARRLPGRVHRASTPTP